MPTMQPDEMAEAMRLLLRRIDFAQVLIRRMSNVFNFGSQTFVDRFSGKGGEARLAEIENVIGLLEKGLAEDSSEIATIRSYLSTRRTRRRGARQERQIVTLPDGWELSDD